MKAYGELALLSEGREHFDKPLWIVYGDECFPQILCAKLADDALEYLRVLTHPECS